MNDFPLASELANTSVCVSLIDHSQSAWRILNEKGDVLTKKTRTKLFFFSATTFSVESGQNVLMCFICHLHVQIVS